VPPMGTNSLKSNFENVQLDLHIKLSTQVNIQIVGLSMSATLHWKMASLGYSRFIVSMLAN